MDRRLPVVGAVATLVAGGIVLALKLRAMSGEPDVTKDAPAEPNARRDDRPRLTDRTASPASTPDTPTVETRVDGSKVRDHRTGERVPYEGRTSSGGAHKDRLPAQLVRDITEKLKVGLADCAARVPAEARGARPGIRGSVSVDVAGGTLTVKETSIEVVDVTGEPSGIAQQCLRESWLGQSTPAADTPEISNYPITVAFSLPSR